MSEFVSIAEGQKQSGLRLVLLRGLPSPWGQAARGIFRVKGLDYTAVSPGRDDALEALEAWTGQTSYPAAMYENEAPRSGWAEILLLAERLAPKPALIPADARQRALLFGVAHEICGEMGLGWARRLVAVDTGLRADPGNAISKMLGDKYGYREDSAVEAPGRVIATLRMLTGLLAESHAAGGRYLLGTELSAVDIYWATFCNLVRPLPPEQLAMPEALRPMFTANDDATLEALDPTLLEHRDMMYAEHLELPVVL